MHLLENIRHDLFMFPISDVWLITQDVTWAYSHHYLKHLSPLIVEAKKQIICEHFFLLNHFLFNVIYELYYCQHIFDININCIFGM